MNTKLLNTIILFLIVMYSAIGQNLPIDIALGNKKTIRLEPCTPSIIRVRVSPDGTFKESLMEHYEIIKNDWAKFNFTKTEDRDICKITTDSIQLVIDKKKASISVKDKNGKVLVSEISLSLTDEKPKWSDFIQSLGGQYEKETAGT